jgi:hypothetical protein
MAVQANGSSEELSDFTTIDVQTVKGHNSLLFTGLSGTDTILYYATGASSLEDDAKDIVRVTDPSQGSVWNLTAISDTTYRYWQDGQVHEVTVNSDGSISTAKPVRSQQTPQDIETEISPSPDQVIMPPGGGDPPDWVSDSDLQEPPKTKSDSAELLGHTWFEVEVTMGETSPVYRADCNGQQIPMLGASIDTIAVETDLDNLSFSLDLFAGVNPNTGCVYLGSESGDFCFQNCTIPLATATAAEVENAIDNAIENGTKSIEDQLGSLGGLSTSKLLLAAGGLTLGVIIAVVASPGIVLWGSLLASGGYLA